MDRYGSLSPQNCCFVLYFSVFDVLSLSFIVSAVFLGVALAMGPSLLALMWDRPPPIPTRLGSALLDSVVRALENDGSICRERPALRLLG